MAHEPGGLSEQPVWFREVRERIALIANSVARFEPVVMLGPASAKEQIEAACPRNVEFWQVPTDDLWCRDAGPAFVVHPDGRQAVVDFNFNGWGDKYTHANDRKVAGAVARRLGLSVINNGLTGEGGGVETDGTGTAIAHESSWVNGNRNNLSKAEVETRLKQALGVEKVIWAPGVVDRDITDYHIDSLARFVRPGLVAIQLPETIDIADPFSEAAFETYEILQTATDANGNRIDLEILPSPLKTRSTQEEFVASYANYYVCNGAVIAAEFGDDYTDGVARDLLGKLYPDREIVMLNIDPIAEAGGGIHCATQQQPVAKAKGLKS